jgi:hypothetical protein
MAPTSHSKSERAVDRISAVLREVAPKGWARISITVSATVLAYDYAVRVGMPDGTDGGDVRLPPEILAEFDEMRSAMYEPGRGTWFSARLVLERGVAPEVTFDFDGDPQWWPPLHPAAFLRDLQAFPRDEEHVPEWLRRLRDEGAALEQEHTASGSRGTTPSAGGDR